MVSRAARLKRPDCVRPRGNRAADGAVTAHEHGARSSAGLVRVQDLIVPLEQHLRQPMLGDFRTVGLRGALADQGQRHPVGVLPLPAADIRQQRHAGAAAWGREEQQDRFTGARRASSVSVSPSRLGSWKRGAGAPTGSPCAGPVLTMPRCSSTVSSRSRGRHAAHQDYFPHCRVPYDGAPSLALGAPRSLPAVTLPDRARQRDGGEMVEADPSARAQRTRSRCRLGAMRTTKRPL